MVQLRHYLELDHPVRSIYTYYYTKSLNTTFETNVNKNNSGSKRDLFSQQVRPDNGNFDSKSSFQKSRLSQFVIPHPGKIYIRDLKSAMGHFVNGVKIGQNDVELKFEHRKSVRMWKRFQSNSLMNTVSDPTNFGDEKQDHTNKNNGTPLI
ncbi:ATV_HP_G0015050.mRNA.1.CDS.1 [Saccharomyces cerevisiae]|nr:ATV_HP_G0015050.mRNA.1.CDS.1 [Saccharomyces cerevisiae]CAI6950022.1 ATV_HP_G0015050.mRNA.1.CDS.1 [Saccharomyces cerevisiae]